MSAGHTRAPGDAESTRDSAHDLLSALRVVIGDEEPGHRLVGAQSKCGPSRCLRASRDRLFGRRDGHAAMSSRAQTGTRGSGAFEKGNHRRTALF